MKSSGAFRFFRGKLKIITLPAYSAELNPVEKLSMTQRNYREDSCRALSLFSINYLRSELSGSKKCPCRFQKAE